MNKPNSKVKVIAAFDFDGTIIRGDTMFILHKLLHNKISRIFNYIKLIPFCFIYIFKIINLTALKEKFYRIVLEPLTNNYSKDKFNKFISENLYLKIRKKIKIDAKKRIQWHLKKGHRVVVISASPRDFIKGVANDLGVELIATETNLENLPNIDIKKFKFTFTSKNCKGNEKVIRLANYVDHALEDYIIYAYGDSIGDKELLQVADYSYLNLF
ncbi:HAD family hydrolase [uncultured Prochlorococcus sp.]|uniref:HAD family hydrolase n=1 Tax=uncultured Prochlorococcus sp. TaxID=159733 RepID=UPI00258AFEA8|nr:HAD family hydrolase [uncultured Prochlorococcus sp.]